MALCRSRGPLIVLGAQEREPKVIKLCILPVLDLVLDGVSVVREGLLKKLLDVVYRRPCQAPVAARDDQDLSHVEAARFLVTAVIMPGRGCRP
jgi:hypothetical protein